MVSLLFVVISAGLAAATSLTAPQLNDRLDPWELQAALGILAFIFAQFLVFTPIRMWRDAVWVANIEVLLDSLWIEN